MKRTALEFLIQGLKSLEGQILSESKISDLILYSKQAEEACLAIDDEKTDVDTVDKAHEMLAMFDILYSN